MERKKRYQEKIELAEKRILEAEEWIPLQDEKSKLAAYKAFQEIVEAISDIIAMLLKDKGKLIEDDYKNIEKITQLKMLDEKDAKILEDANGLRNRIIHKYNRTDDAIAKESIQNLLPQLKTILKKFEHAI